MTFNRMVLAAALIAMATGAEAASATQPAQGLFGPGGILSLNRGSTSTNANTSFWQGSWGIEGMTPVVTVSGQAVSYEGSNKQPFPVSNVAITGTNITFLAGGAAVSLTKRSDANADMVSTISGNSSQPILLCKSDAPHCP